MSSDPFELLGLERTSATEADVRKAYAQRLKVTRPEDDREGFIALRAAFELARQEARWREQYPDDAAQEDEQDGGDESHSGRRADDATESLADTPPTEDTLSVHTHPASLDERIDEAMEQLIQALTAPWGPPRTTDLAALLDAQGLDSIDEYQALRWRVRLMLCEATGYYRQHEKVQIPDWLTLRVLNELENHFNWIRQPSIHPQERRQNAWLRSVHETLDWNEMPQEVRKQRELDKLLGRTPENPRGTSDGSNTWLFIGASILVFVVFRALTGWGR